MAFRQGSRFKWWRRTRSPDLGQDQYLH